MLRPPRLATIVYVVVGLAIARSHEYFLRVETAQEIGSAALAVVLWPLLLLGIDLHIRR